MSEFITIGEPLVVFASEEADKSLAEVSQFKKFLAGAELNVAVGLAKLGHSTDYISQVGQDSFGDFILTELSNRNVGNHLVKRSRDYPTGFYLKEKVTAGDPQVEYFRKNSAAAHFVLDDLPESSFEQLKVLHVTGIMAGISENGLAAVEQLLTELSNRAVTIFDPNIRQALWKTPEIMIETLNRLAKKAQIVLPGIAEGKLLTGLSNAPEIADFYLQQSERTNTVVVKDGSKGAYVKTKSGQAFQVASYKVDKVVDTVGAGDGFAAGLISGILDDLEFDKAVKRACAIGALAVQSSGDNEAYPTRSELEDFMKNNQ